MKLNKDLIEIETEHWFVLIEIMGLMPTQKRMVKGRIRYKFYPQIFKEIFCALHKVK
jgi:hypothetical protein